MPSLPALASALLVATLLATSHPASANDPDQGPPDSLRIGPIDPEWMTRTDDFHPSPGSNEHRLIGI